MDEEDTKFELLEIENLVESDDFTIFNQEDLPVGGFQVMEEIRRKGKLCDVTLKVRMRLREKKIIKKNMRTIMNSMYIFSSNLYSLSLMHRYNLAANT